MASIMLTAMPFAGHVLPVRAVAAELVRRGHDVRAYTGSAYVDAFAAVGATGVPCREAPDFDERNYVATFPRLRDRKGFRQLAVNLQDMFVATAPAQSRDLLAAHARRPWDVLAGDPMVLGTRFAAEHTRSPWTGLSPVPVMVPSADGPPAGLGLDPGRGLPGRARDAVLRGLAGALAVPLNRTYRRARAQAGLGPDRHTAATMWYSPQQVIAAGSPALHGSPAVPPEIRYVGDLTDSGAPGPEAAPPFWWDDVVTSRRPVVHVTQGTANVDPSDLILPAIEALAGEEVLVVVGTGHRTPPLPRPLPANVRAGPMLPYDDLLPRTSVMITNGGFGGVLRALRHGVPLVVAGGDLDKPEIASRVARSGAGINLRSGTPRPAAIRAAHRRIATDPAFRAAARRVGAELTALGGTRRAADLVEALVPDRGGHGTR